MIRTVDHAGTATLAHALANEAAWFAIGQADPPLPDALAARATWHRCGPAGALVVEDLQVADLRALRPFAAHAMLNRPQALVDTPTPTGLGRMLRLEGYRLFRRGGGGAEAAPHDASPIGELEFLLSDSARLAAYPHAGGVPARGDGPARIAGRRRAVFVLDLVQDFEVLRPFLQLAAAPGSPFDACMAVTERVLSSQLGNQVAAFARQVGLPWFKPLGVADVATALGAERALLVTASETSAPGHAFAHNCCRTAPPRTLRATFQHGYECIGLMHHRAHDLQFPQGVRFASDVIFTWRGRDTLPELHPGDADRVLAVGVTKACAERAQTLMQARWERQPAWPAQGEPASADALVVAENLHSVRFASPLRYRRFLAFIEGVAAREDLKVVIRSHPGKRTLEKARADKPYRFLEGPLEAEAFMAAAAWVSPPSTVVLDAALCGRPVALWSDAERLGDVQNYQGLPMVQAAADVDALLASPGAVDRSQSDLGALQWAVHNTSALNGVPAAWQHLCTLSA